jgi:hypothetical protein
VPKRWKVEAVITLTDTETNKRETARTKDEYDEESDARKKFNDKKNA